MRFLFSLAAAAVLATSGVVAEDGHEHDESTSHSEDPVPMADPATVQPADPAMECVSIADAASAAGLTTLVEAIVQFADSGPDAQALLDMVQSTTPLPADQRSTVFAPTNEAFDMVQDSPALPGLLEILLNHVVMADLNSSMVLEAVAGSETGIATVASLVGDLDVSTDTSDDGMTEITITPTGSTVSGTVVVADVDTCVGTVHVIDAVLIPSIMISPDVPEIVEETEVMDMTDTDSVNSDSDDDEMTTSRAVDPVPVTPMVPPPTPTATPATPTTPIPVSPAVATPPPPASNTSAPVPTPTPPRSNATCFSVAEAAALGNLTILIEAITAVAPRVDLVEALLNAATMDTPVAEEDEITIFAPTDAAFELIATNDSLPRLDTILLNHVVLSNLPVAEVLQAINMSAPDPAVVPTLGGKNLTAMLNTGNVTITPEGTDIESTVILTDIRTCVGTVHVVDRVLVPDLPPATEMAPMPATAANSTSNTTTIPTATPAAPPPPTNATAADDDDGSYGDNEGDDAVTGPMAMPSAASDDVRRPRSDERGERSNTRRARTSTPRGTRRPRIDMETMPMHAEEDAPEATPRMPPAAPNITSADP